METQTESAITLAELWEILKNHIVHILLVVLLCEVLLFDYSGLILQPQYNSTATLYVLRQKNADDYVYTPSDFTLALDVVNDCRYMLKSHAVLDDVISELGLDMSYDELYDRIETSNPDGTRILEVSVKTLSAQESKRIADCVCRTASDRISAAMGMDQVNIYSEGILEDKPCNSIGFSGYAITGISAAAVMYAVFLTAYLVDDRNGRRR